MKNIIKIVKSLEDSSLLPEGVSETIQSEAKEQRVGFLSMLLHKLGASSLGNIWRGKGAIAKRQDQRINRAGEEIVKAGYGKNKEQNDKIMKTKWIFNAASSLN